MAPHLQPAPHEQSDHGQVPRSGFGAAAAGGAAGAGFSGLLPNRLDHIWLCGEAGA